MPKNPTENSRCAVCGRLLEPNEVPDFDAAFEGQAVCDECRDRYAEELETSVDRARCAYLDEMRDFGER